MIDNLSECIHDAAAELSEGVRSVIEDVFTNQIIVYTPKGDMKELPQGATPIDFAYSVHTEIGHSCRAALVYGRHHPLNQPLQDGDSIKILRHGSAPQRTWLDDNLGYLQTRVAKSAVRRWFRQLSPSVAVEQGRKLLQDELHMLGLSDYSHLLVAGWFGYTDVQTLYHALGRAEILPAAVAVKVLTDLWLPEPGSHSHGQSVESADGEWFIITNAGGRPLRMCHVCHPRPGDQIVGTIHKNGYVTVHTIACTRPNPEDLMGGRGLKLRWGEEGKEEVHPIALRIHVHDRDGLLSEITDLIRAQQVNIIMVCSRVFDHKATIILGIEAHSPNLSVQLLHQMQALENVIDVQCLPSTPTSWWRGADPQGFCPFNAFNNDPCQNSPTSVSG